MERKCLSGADPQSPARVPTEGDFFGQYKPAPELDEIVRFIGAGKAGMGHLAEYEIKCYWRAKASKRNGVIVAGTASKTSGLLALTSEADFTIVLAADYCRMLDNYQLEALVYHECCHIAEDEDAEGNETPIIVAHDLEMFRAELREYGYWTPALIAASREFRQLELTLEDAQLAPA